MTESDSGGNACPVSGSVCLTRIDIHPYTGHRLGGVMDQNTSIVPECVITLSNSLLDVSAHGEFGVNNALKKEANAP